MLNKVKVEAVKYSELNKCCVIEYEKESKSFALAAVAEKLCPKVGDIVWVLENDQLNYKGFGAVAVLLT